MLGYDFVNCGFYDELCWLVKLVVFRVIWGGRIFLNGIGIEKYLYDCGDSNIIFYINKRVIIEGVYFKFCVFCYYGINF